MASFGDSISALVETYTKCLRLLKAFKSGSSDTQSIDPSSAEVQSLRSSIRSDRAQVRKAYSLRLSKVGKRLEKGDSRSKSALRRILERLKNAITKLLGMAKVQRPAVDYESLMSLSNSSRIGAIKTMHRLSSRLSSSSNLSRDSHRAPSKANSRGSHDNGRLSPRHGGTHGNSATSNREKGKISKEARVPVHKKPASEENEGRKRPHTEHTPAAMSDPAAALASLLRASSIQDHEEVLKAANAAIKASRSNTQAHHTRVVALLKLDRFDDALRALTDGGDKLESECLPEKAYALYKSGRLAEAEDTVRSIQPITRASRHLAGQIAYRAEKFEDAAQIYHELSTEGEGQPGEENDLKINTLATNAQLQWKGLGHLVGEDQKQPSREDLEAFETAYNAACGCVARGDLSKASILLKRARDLCEASDDLTPDEKTSELLPLLIQHAHVLTRLGKEAEAMALQKSIALSEVTEPSSKAIAQNNQAAVAFETQNPYLTQRLFESASASKLSGNDKLFEYQLSALRRNNFILSLQMHKFDGVERSTNKKILEASTTAASAEIAGLGVVNAAAHAHLQTGKAAINKILPMLEKRPADVGLLLTVIQLYIQTNNPGPALGLLEAFLKRVEQATTPDHNDARFSPGLVAVTVAVYRLFGRHNSVRAELAKAATHWKSRSKESPTSLLREAGIELLKSSNPDDLSLAGVTFEDLAARSNGDIIAAAGLVASFATTNYAKVEPYLKNLTPAEKVISGIDVQALIDAGVASVATTSSPGTKRSADTEPQKPNKRFRKKKLPKDYEEGKEPDPERWLPLRDRSTYRPKGKKGKKRAQEATQGGVVKEEETLELVGGAGAVKVEKATGGGKKKNKKKK
ncbi:signal recognition particle subunit SRP72 [Seiridium cupressi]